MLLGFEQCQKRYLYSQDTDPVHSSSEPTTCLDRNQIKLEMKIPPEPLCASRPLGGGGVHKNTACWGHQMHCCHGNGYNSFFDPVRKIPSKKGKFIMLAFWRI